MKHNLGCITNFQTQLTFTSPNIASTEVDANSTTAIPVTTESNVTSDATAIVESEQIIGKSASVEEPEIKSMSKRQQKALRRSQKKQRNSEKRRKRKQSKQSSRYSWIQRKFEKYKLRPTDMCSDLKAMGQTVFTENTAYTGISIL